MHVLCKALGRGCINLPKGKPCSVLVEFPIIAFRVREIGRPGADRRAAPADGRPRAPDTLPAPRPAAPGLVARVKAAQSGRRWLYFAGACPVYKQRGVWAIRVPCFFFFFSYNFLIFFCFFPLYDKFSKRVTLTQHLPTPPLALTHNIHSSI